MSCTSVCLDVFFFFLMRRRPPRSTRTDTLFPYTTLFLSHVVGDLGEHRGAYVVAVGVHALGLLGAAGDQLGALLDALADVLSDPLDLSPARQRAEHGALGEGIPGLVHRLDRSEERRVGKGGVSTCKSRWYPYT